jgi:Tfp pilus assembly PilM family ATPase
MAKNQTFVGIDMDSVSIRGVRLSFDPNSGKGKSPKPAWRLLSVAEVNNNDNLLDDANAVSALKNLRENLRVRMSDKVSICLSGKQTYSVQMDVRKLPDEEMAGMLKLELRKSIPFEAAAATFDYQLLPAESSGRADAGMSAMIGVVADSYLNRQIDIYGKAGLPPCHANVLPISVANAFWAAHGDETAPEEAVLLLHFGSDFCTLVIDGRQTPFFNRAFSFNAAKAVGDSETPEVEGKEKSADVSMLMDILADEVAKSAAYYKNTYRVGDISSISVLGAYSSHRTFDELTNKTGYPVRAVQTASLVQTARLLEPGKYDLAIALAMQAA